MHVTLRGTAFVVLLLISSLGLAAPKKPQSKPDAEPSLAATMQFIQDKINDQGDVHYYQTPSMGSVRSMVYRLSDVVADAGSCSFKVTDTTTDPEQLVVHNVSFAFKDVEKLTVEKAEETARKYLSQSGHPEATVTYDPEMFSLVLTASKQAFSLHEMFTQPDKPPYSHDVYINSYHWMFSDEETANRVAKAMVHAIELCGGGKKDPF